MYALFPIRSTWYVLCRLNSNSRMYFALKLHEVSPCPCPYSCLEGLVLVFILVLEGRVLVFILVLEGRVLVLVLGGSVLVNITGVLVTMLRRHSKNLIGCWLKMIEYRLCLLVHKSLMGHVPVYISRLLNDIAALSDDSEWNFVVSRNRLKISKRAFLLLLLKPGIGFPWN